MTCIMTHKNFLLMCTSTLLLAGCSMAPSYERPAAPVAATWPSAAPGQQKEKAFDASWQSFFLDPKLRQLITQALANNRDLRVAALNIKIARAAYRVSWANRLPTVALEGSESAQLTPKALSTSQNATVSRQFNASVGTTAFELDLFGRLDSLKDEALESYLAMEETRTSTQITLVAEVANAYLTLICDKHLYALTEKTLHTREQSLELAEKTFSLGSSSALDLAQAQSLVESAKANLAQYDRQVEQDKNALVLLVGAPLDDALISGPLPDLETTPFVETIAVGMPSEVLLRRPDIAAAEHSLKSANANIGAARAAFFPTISLTGSEGFASPTLGNLFRGASGSWAFAPQVSLPIFDGGRNAANLESAEDSKEIAVAEYEKSIQSAFHEVADDLAAKRTWATQIQAQKAFVAATQKSFSLSQARYEYGISNHLDVLDSERSLYSAQQDLVSAQANRLFNLVNLYKALGGGV